MKQSKLLANPRLKQNQTNKYKLRGRNFGGCLITREVIGGAFARPFGFGPICTPYFGVCNFCASVCVDVDPVCGFCVLRIYEKAGAEVGSIYQKNVSICCA